MIGKKTVFLGLFLMMIGLFCAFGDERTENIDVLLVLDKSLSMRQEIGSVRSYVEQEILNDILIPGDSLMVIQFYGNAEVLINGVYGSGEDLEAFRSQVQTIQADGAFTDIGNALDRLQNELSAFQNNDRRKYMLLLTDGRQEAPEDSPYYSPDGSFNHAFLENTRMIQREGWKIHILGIGEDSAARELAQELSGVYTEVPEAPTEEEIAEQTEDLIAEITIETPVEVAPVSAEGESELVFQAESRGYSNEREITIIQVIITFTQNNAEESVLSEEYVFSVDPAAPQLVRIPLEFSDLPEAGDYSVEVELVTAGNTALVPTIFDTTIHINSWIENNIVLFVAAILVALAVIVAVASGITFLLKKKTLHFRISADTKPLSSSGFALKPGESMFLTLSGGAIEAVKEKTENSVVQIWNAGKELKMRVLEKSRVVSPASIPEKLKNFMIQLKTKAGRVVKIRINKK
ncbi:MAG: vWA domain-containing protein [Spirochaetia bacterium]